MKATKRFLLTLAAILGMTGAMAQDADVVAVTPTANADVIAKCNEPLYSSVVPQQDF